MVYTAIYREHDKLNTFVFVSKHDKNEAWHDFNNNHASPEQELVALSPGHTVVYFDEHISPEI